MQCIDESEIDKLNLYGIYTNIKDKMQIEMRVVKCVDKEGEEPKCKSDEEIVELIDQVTVLLLVKHNTYFPTMYSP